MKRRSPVHTEPRREIYKGLITVATTAAAAAAAAVTAAAAAVFTTTAAATAAGRTFFTGLGHVDSEGASIDGLAVHAFDRLLGFFGGTHGDETEAARTAGGAIHHQIGFGDRTERGKRVLEVVFSGIEGKISNK